MKTYNKIESGILQKARIEWKFRKMNAWMGNFDRIELTHVFLKCIQSEREKEREIENESKRRTILVT